ncbi:purine-nucleoside phosphorylase [Rhodothermus profundi]|uniref:Purine nucleoside phosphorylase n=1 Tax=Rhodothermus profundi TaxID=633813 RepID=A0A1M6TDD1_9BACT|nr:purine-nucleoside phosphorylase [Rhodothermus profundi]SHK55042.1 purine-nucleoside phosphorylase [Rhodothermus profundi]
MMAHSEVSLQAALDWLKPRLRETPEVALILGSGLGALAESVSAAIEVPVQEIPGYPTPTVSGHAGRLVFGRLEGCRVVVLQGRLHCYEGYPPQTVTLPVRLVHALGARSLIVTNAAGGLNPHFRPGMLMLIADHINAAFRNPLVGQLDDSCLHMRGAPDMAQPYDLSWLAIAEAVALRLGIPIRRGVYLWTLGPSYETKAEIRMYRRMGADAVGMSTVPEVLQARKLGMKVLGISTITNMAAGLHSGPLTHEEVLQVGLQVRNQLERLIRGILYQQSAKKF